MSSKGPIFWYPSMLSASDSRLFSYLSVPTLLFFLVPGSVVNNNLDDFYFVDAILAIFFSLSAILLTAFMFFLIEKLFINETLKRIFHHILKFLFIFLFITGLYLPLSFISGMTTIDTAPINRLNLTAAVILTLMIFGLSCSRFRVPVNMGIVTFFFLNILLSAYGFFGLYSQNLRHFDEARENFRNLSERRNIIVMSFDGIPRDVAADVLRAEDDLRSMFSDFRFFTNVISSSPASGASISAEMYGNRNFKTQAQTEEELIGLDVPNLITNKLEARGYNVSTYGLYSREFQNPNKILKLGGFLGYDLSREAEKVLFSYDYIIVLLATRHALKVFNKTGIKNNLLELVDYVNSHLRISQSLTADEKILSNRINNSHGQKWDRPLIESIMDYQHYVDGVRVNETSDVAHFMHFTHTHYPVNFDRECRFRSDDETWHRARQNEAGIADEAYCALTQMARFLARLRQLGVYDRSLVVFKSDHGKPASYFNKSELRSFKIRNNRKWGYNRYTPLLMIKDFHSRAENIDFDDNPAMLDDLARSLCLHSGIEADCTIYPGFDLLALDLHIPEQTGAVIFIVKDRYGSFKYDTHEALHLPRSKDFYRTLHDAMVTELLTEAVSCEQPIIIDQNTRFNNGFSDYRSWVAWSEGETRFLKLKLDRCAQAAFVAVESAAADRTGGAFSVAINGRDGGDQITTANPEAQSASTYRIAIQPEDGNDNGVILVGLAPTEPDLPADFRFVGIEFAPPD